MNKPNISVQQGFAQRHSRSVLAVAVLIILSVVLACLVMTCGNTYYSLAEVWNILTSEGTKGAAFTIKTLRLPKMLVGILAGIAFGMSGNTFQTLLRNPLASPDIIGVTSGASAAAVFCILMLKWSGGIVSLVAVLAGLFVAALIYLLARDRHGYSGGRMILIGIGMQAMLNALISWMLLKGSEYDVATALRWLRGSLNGVQMSDVPVLSITVLVGGFILIVLNRSLQVMQLGEEYPITLGAPVQRVRLGSILCALLLTAVATSITGPIASVAFLSGPIASRIVGKGRSNLLASALVGVVLILASELVGQNLFAVRYPVGVITGILGAPYLLLLLLQINKKGERV